MGTATADTPDTGRLGRVVAALGIVAVLGGLLVVQSARPTPVVPAGFSSRGDGARTGVVSTSPVPPPSGVVWRAPVDLPPLLSPGADVLGTTVTADDRELVVVLDPAAEGQRVTAHDAGDGSVVATTMLPLGNQPYATSLAGGLLAHRDLTSVTLVELATGTRRWTVEQRLRDDTAVTGFGVVGVLAAGPPSAVVLLDLEDGTERWRTELDGGGRVTRVLGTDTAIVLAVEDTDGPLLLALDPATGEQRWSLRRDVLPPPGTFPTAPPMTDGRDVLVLGRERAVVVQAATGATTELPLPPGLEPATGGIDRDTVVVTDATSRIVLFTGTAGTAGGPPAPTVRWEVGVNRPPVFAVELAAGTVAVRADSGTTLLDRATGAMASRVAPAGGSTRLSLSADGGVARVLPAGEVELVAADGLRWRAPTVAVHLPDLATDDGAVAVTTPDGIQVHDVVDGTRRFAHEAFQAALVTAGSLTAPVLLDGRAAVAPPLTQPPDRGGLLALFADTGIVDWARREDRVVPRGTPVVDRDLLLLPVGSQLLGFDRRSGARTLVVETSIARSEVAASGDWLVAADGPRDAGDVWVGRRSTRDMIYRAPIRTCAPPLIHDELTILSTHLGDLIARSLADGTQPWGERAQGSACRPLTIADDTLVALVDDRVLLGVGLDDGETTWRVELPDVAAGAPVLAGGQLLVPTLAGELLAWEVGADEPTWRVTLGAVPAGAVAVDGDTVLVLTRDGELLGLR